MKRTYFQFASSSSSSTPQNNYDVFLSFRGDTRNNFTSHLYKALCQKGIETFLDEDKLERGKVISPELKKVIESSRCLVVILSRDYASSSWCMDELVKILQCMKDFKTKHTVLPIFYHVNPDHIKKREGSVWYAFKSLEQEFRHDMEKVESWRAALIEVVKVAGYRLQDDRNEAKFIENFIKEVSSKLDVVCLKFSKDLVGMHSRLEKLESCISRSRFEDVRFIGICGMGGLGKTTLARAYFNIMSSQFEAGSFLADVRQKAQNGLEKLQEQLLTDILIGEHKISNVYDGIDMIKKRLRHKKVLVILDDVDQSNQLEGLAKEKKWFGDGSRIVLTTRDESLLKRMYGEEEYIIHKVDKLKYSDALQLFSSKAFKSNRPREDYIELSKKVIEYANGLPLALRVLGSFLRTCESIAEWKSALDRLKEYPEEEIIKTLRISFDALKETEKSIFLDIACFFNGSSKQKIMKIVDCCGFFPEIGIRSLVDKSLLHVERNDKLRMHDLLEEMGKEIVREKSRNEPGRRSRIWLWEDFYHVMVNDTGTEEVEAIQCQCREELEENFSLRGFSNMKKLRLLICDFRLKRDECPNNEYVSNELRFLAWAEFPFNSFPPSFQPHGLVELRLVNSKIKQLWNYPTKPLYNLKSIDLTGSKKIKKFEGFSMFPNLEKLILDFCMFLEEIHPSIAVLKRLTLLSLVDCQRLESLPNVDGLESLRVLKLSRCSSLGNLPEDLGRLNNLEELNMTGTGLRDILKWKNILNAIVGNGLSSDGLYSLEKLDLSNSGLRDGVFPDDFGCLVSLEYLNLSDNYFSFLPARFNRLSKLRHLNLSRCRNLTSLGPELPDSLEMVSVDHCRELHTFLDPLSQCNLRCSEILCRNCFKLVNRQGSKRTALTSLGRYLQYRPSPSKRFDIVLPGNTIASWFTNQVWRSSSISLPLHPNWCTNKWMGFALATVLGGELCSERLFWQIKINQEDWGFGPVYNLGQMVIEGRHILLLYLPRDTYFHTEWQKKFGQIEFSLFSKIYRKERSEKFKQCGVRLVYEQDVEQLYLTATHEPLEPPANEFSFSYDEDFC